MTSRHEKTPDQGAGESQVSDRADDQQIVGDSPGQTPDGDVPRFLTRRSTRRATAEEPSAASTKRKNRDTGDSCSSSELAAMRDQSAKVYANFSEMYQECARFRDLMGKLSDDPNALSLMPGVIFYWSERCEELWDEVAETQPSMPGVLTPRGVLAVDELDDMIQHSDSSASGSRSRRRRFRY